MLYIGEVAVCTLRLMIAQEPAVAMLGRRSTVLDYALYTRDSVSRALRSRTLWNKLGEEIGDARIEYLKVRQLGRVVFFFG
jgi:hypothetical protein